MTTDPDGTTERLTTTRDRANDARLGSGARRETMDEAKGATATARVDDDRIGTSARASNENEKKSENAKKRTVGRLPRRNCRQS